MDKIPFGIDYFSSIDKDYEQSKQRLAAIEDSTDSSSRGCTERFAALQSARYDLKLAQTARRAIITDHHEATREFFEKERETIIDKLPFTD